jgi:hypothetical protein
MHPVVVAKDRVDSLCLVVMVGVATKVAATIADQYRSVQYV